jgi:hypothetical protein
MQARTAAPPFLSFATAPGEPMAGGNAAAPVQFSAAQTNIATTDLAAAPDGASIASRNFSLGELHDGNLALQSVTAQSELEGIPQRTNFPGIGLHPSGVPIYVPFLTVPAPASPTFTGLQGGVDIVEAHTGRLRLCVSCCRNLCPS